MQKYRLANPEPSRQSSRKWYRANKIQVYLNNRKWVVAHPEARRDQHRRRRALKKGNEHSFTDREFQTLVQRYGSRCVSCWKAVSELASLGRKLVPDHIVPLAKGGLNDITNIQPLCHGVDGCNNHKGNKYQDFVIS